MKNSPISSQADNPITFPDTIKIEGIAQNPEGIEYDKNDQTFLLGSLNAGPIIKVDIDGTYKPFTSGEPYPLSTVGLQIDYNNNKLLAAVCNGAELFDGDPNTRGTSNLRIYNLETGVMEKDINLSSLVPDASAYFANDVAIDGDGNIYITDWYAAVVYKVDSDGNPTVFWQNNTGIPSGANGIDFHPDGYLLVSLVSVNEQGLYADFGLVKVPVNNPEAATLVDLSGTSYTGFDGMVLKPNGNVIGVTNNGTSPGGNMLVELSGKNGWESAEIINSKEMTASTTVAVTPDDMYYVINQDFSDGFAKTWTIERIEY